MVTDNSKEQKLRDSMFGRMHLSGENERIARQYLDMEHEENPALLAAVQHQDLSDLFPINGYAEYLKWLRKNKRTAELSRYVRFVTEVGGSTAWSILVNDDYEAKLPDLEGMLPYLTGEHAEEQKTALRAELCAKTLHKDKRTEDTRALCRSGKENPEIFRRALDYCYVFEKADAKNRYKHHARMLLAAVYLYCKEPGTAPEMAEMLVEDLIADIPAITTPAKAFSEGEIQCLQNYVRTAGKDTPFPQRVLTICCSRRGWMDDTFQTGCAFLALRHSVRFEILFRLMLGEGFNYKNRITALEIAGGIVEAGDFCANMAEIQEMLPLLDEDYIIWCLYGNQRSECEAEIQRMARECPDGIRAAVQKADSEEYRKLTRIVETASPALYEEIHASYREVFLEKLALELVDWHGTCEETARQYLLGKCPLAVLDSGIRQCEDNRFGYCSSRSYERVNQLKELGEYEFYRRVIILETLKGKPDFIIKYPVSEETVEKAQSGSLLCDRSQIAGIFEIFALENVPAGLQLEALGRVCDSVENKKDRTLFLDACAEVLAERQREQDGEQWEEALSETLRQGGASACCISLKVLAQYESPEPCKEALFALTESAAEQVQKALLEVFKKHTEWEADVLSLLASKKQRPRGFAIMVLEEWAQGAHLEAVRTALAKEKNKKLAAQLQALAEALEKAETAGGQQGRPEEKAAAEIYKGGRKRKVEWVQDMNLPMVHFQDDTGAAQETAPPEYMPAILAAYADMEVPGISRDAKMLAAPLVPRELAAYVRALYSGWLTAGAEAKKRWVLYAAALHGDPELIVDMHRQIKDWAEHSRGALAAEAVRALALNGSSQALLLVDQMARKFKSNQIRNAAKKALSDAAAALEITREELEDRIVPDFGFNAQMERVFDYGPRAFTVRLNLSLETEIYDGNGKKLKNLPAPGKQDDPEKANQAQEELKQLKKQLKLAVASQKLRLEQALTTARFWQAEKWRGLFVQNPVMHQFALGLIWGTYEGGALKDTFRYMEDGSFNMVDEREFALPESGVIGLVHPLELSEEMFSAWKEQLSDYEVTQPIEQLERPVYHVTEEEKTAQEIMRFYDRELNCLSLSGKLLSLGWERGEILDGGVFDSYCRSDDAFGAKLTFSGCPVGYENEEVTIDTLYFYRTVDGMPRKQVQCSPGEVSARYFSETVLQIARIVEN